MNSIASNPTQTQTTTDTTTATTGPLSCGEGVPELLTQVQLAQRLGISRRTLSTWVRQKIVPMIKIRGYCRFDFAKVRAALERYAQADVGSAEAAAPGRSGIVPIPPAQLGAQAQADASPVAEGIKSLPLGQSTTPASAAL